MVAWYTAAWFDKYVKGDASADRRLLTTRWQSDSLEAAIDPNHDGNMFSSYYPSRLDIGLARGGRFGCEDLRSGCAGMVVRRRPVRRLLVPGGRHDTGGVMPRS